MTRQLVSQQRKIVRGDRSSLKFDGNDSVAVTYNFPTDAFSVSFWYNSLMDKELQDNDQIFGKSGSFSFGRQSTNPAYVYAYLDAPNDYAGLRHLRFKATKELKPLGWHNRVIVVYVEDDTAYMKEYEDNELIKTSTVDYTGSSSTPSGNLYIGNSQGSSSVYGFHGLIKGVKIYNRKLTSSEVRDLYYSKNIEYDPDGEWKFDEGAGSTVYDTSGNGNNGIIIGATWSADVPSPTRKKIDGNLVPNGDFSIAPPFAGESDTGVVDNSSAYASAGTYGVSTSGEKEIYKWKADMYQTSSPRGAKYDFEVKQSGIASMKLSGTDIKERVNITLGQRQYGDLNNQYDIREHLIPVKPNMAYTLSVVAKIDIESQTGDPFGTNHVAIDALEHSSSSFKAHNRLYFDGTETSWAEKTLTFTTTADTRYINIYAGIGGNSTNYWTGSMWLDKIVLKLASVIIIGSWAVGSGMVS